MQRLTCTGCDCYASQGYIFDNPAIRICGSCRDVILTFLKVSGFTMTDESWLVKELCEDSHVVTLSRWRFCDLTTHEPSIVGRIRK